MTLPSLFEDASRTGFLSVTSGAGTTLLHSLSETLADMSDAVVKALAAEWVRAGDEVVGARVFW